MQINLQEQQQTSRQEGYHNRTANNAMEFSMAFANLEKATAEYLSTVANLTIENSTLTYQVALYTNRLSTKESDNMVLQTAIKNLQG